MNYTAEQAAMMVERYQENPCRETVDELAEELGKSVKSIIGKLSKEGVYRRQAYVTKTGEKPVTKLELVTVLADSLEMSTSELVGLEKAPKPVLKALVEKLS